MEGYLAPRLWVCMFSVTVLWASYVVVGAASTAAWGAITLLAFLAWAFFVPGSQSTNQPLIATYLLVIVLSLVLATCHYWSGVPATLDKGWWTLLAPQLPMSERTWFFLFVTLPISLLMLGGYAILQHRVFLPFFAWWGFLYAVLQAGVHLILEFGPFRYVHHAYLGTVVASALLITGVTGCATLLRAKPSQTVSEPLESNARQTNRWTALFACLIIVYGASLYLQAGFLPVGVIVASMAGGLLGWRKTTARHPAPPLKAVPLYLLLQMLFFIHVGEETLTAFNQGIAAITGVPWPDRSFTYMIGLIGPAIWMLGALSLWFRQPFGNFLLWFLIIGMIVGEPAHLLVFPVMAMHQTGGEYRYFSGMYTALLPMVPAILALRVILLERRKHKVQVR